MMRLPADRLPPNRLEAFFEAPFGGRFYYIREYTGPAPIKGYGQKPIVGPPVRPFAELQCVQRLQKEGWAAGWSYRPGEFIETWEPERRCVQYPSDASTLIDRIAKRAGSRARCWDIFAWKDWQPLFIDLKRRGSSERLGAAQKRWREAALDVGVMPSAFREFQWLGGSLDGYRLKAMSMFQARIDSWVQYRKGKLEFGGPDPKEAKDWVEMYRRATGLEGADLLWVVFRDNADGACTYWDIAQHKERGGDDEA